MIAPIMRSKLFEISCQNRAALHALASSPSPTATRVSFPTIVPREVVLVAYTVKVRRWRRKTIKVSHRCTQQGGCRRAILSRY